MTEDTQKFLKHLPDLRFESRQTDAKGLGVITTYLVFRKRIAARHQNDDIQSVEDLDNEEDEKESRVSDLFADSEESQKIIQNIDTQRNAQIDPQISNTGRGPNDQFEQSIIEQDGSDDGKRNESDKNRNVTFDLPKYLIFVKKKNRKYESYIFKKNVENYKFSFNLSIIFAVICFAISEVNVITDHDGGLHAEQTVYLI